MFAEKIFFCLSLIILVNSNIQINFHLTDWATENEHIQHHCLQVPALTESESDPRQIISYCMGEWPSKYSIKEHPHEHKFTFQQLAEQKITNEQLYLWSAPIDLIEKYQLYLDQLSTSEKSSFQSEIFYNCTWPYFGVRCEYVLDYDHSSHSSLDELVHDYYRYNRYQPALLTCYVHLECHRSPSPSCLDWREICDGKIDCLNDGLDERYCWLMEMQDYHPKNSSNSNRQCISEPFFRDDSKLLGCIGKSNPSDSKDETHPDLNEFGSEPTFAEEDVSCAKNFNIPDNAYSHTSRCFGSRINILSEAIFSMKPEELTDECWSAIKCRLMMDPTSEIESMICRIKIVDQIIGKSCPDLIRVPATPIWLGHIYILYEKNDLFSLSFHAPPAPSYFCYDDQHLYIPDSSLEKIFVNNRTCHSMDVIVTDSRLARQSNWFRLYMIPLYFWLKLNTIPLDTNLHLLDQSMIYQCENSTKKIAQSGLFDGVIDCPESDDEYSSANTCPGLIQYNLFRCTSINDCFPNIFVGNNKCDCLDGNKGLCEDEKPEIFQSLTKISFQTICDGYQHLLPEFFNDSNETDETNCEHWPRIHTYNRCDGIWHLPDGSDELNCDPSPLLNCSIDHHICVSPQTNQLICLPIHQANDGIINCLGAADEPVLCPDYLYSRYPYQFYCQDKVFGECIPDEQICDGYKNCYNGDDEQACQLPSHLQFDSSDNMCQRNYELEGSDTVKILCRRFFFAHPRLQVHFTFDQSHDVLIRREKQKKSFQHRSTQQRIELYQPRCHRGLPLQIYSNQEKNLCLCPPSYYGDQCQYQNERVTLTLQFRVTSESVRIPFAILVSLYEQTDQRWIHSSEQFTYLSMKDCQREFNIYLLYSTKPKDMTKDYFIQIEIYEKETLNYRASFLKRLNFTFLPVHRVALHLLIPSIVKECFNDQCEHGQCREYANNETYCSCERGWGGRFCHLSSPSECSSDSLSMGKMFNNRSVCLCPMNRIGPRCLINDGICRSETCLNDGKCLSIDQYGKSTEKYLCICPKEFIGDRCEINRNKFLLSFDSTLLLPKILFIHFIQSIIDQQPARTTTFKTISFDQTSLVLYWSLPFHLVFIEFSNRTYYLVHVNGVYNQSQLIEKQIDASDRCLDVKELFNATMANSSLLIRIKFYHLFCRRNTSQLKCFYDEIHFCFCQEKELIANCFLFDHQFNFNCSGQNGCLNNGQCFQEQTSCPRISVCQCPDCFYGSQCQLTSNAFTLSLDLILAFHIRPNVNLSSQPVSILISLILMIIATCLGLGNGISCLMTFREKKTRESGCGIYLLTSSIVVLGTMMIFVVKFVILLLTQMGQIKHFLFLSIQCHSLDFLLRLCLTIDQWLISFVALERALIIIKGTNFNSKRSKLIAKWLISILILINILTHLPDPFYRTLFYDNTDDDDDQRIWCIVKYPAFIHIINLIINILHLVVPFLINLISAVVIIVLSTRKQAAIKKSKKYHQILSEQVEQHRNLLIGPCVLVILGIPRLILAFFSACIKSSTDAWLFLFAFFISFIPSLLTFILYVYPSTTYKQAFRQAMARWRNCLRRNQ